MCIYLVLDLILLALFWFHTDKNKDLVNKISCILFFLLVACHNGIFDEMFDYTSYMDFFLGKSTRYGTLYDYELEMPYYYLVKLFRIFPIEPITYIVGIAVVFCLPLFYAMKKGYRATAALSLLILLLLNNTNTFRSFMGAQRQMVGCVCFFLAYFSYEYWSFKWHKYIAILFVIIALLSHSSSYLVFPFILLCYFIPNKLSKRTLYIAIVVSWAIGVFLTNIVTTNMTQLMFLLSDYSELDRSTHYMVDEVFAGQTTYALTALTPMALLMMLCIYLYEEEELNLFGVKCWILSFVLYLSLYAVPLMNRGVLMLFLFGITTGLPQTVIDKKNRKYLLPILLLFIYLANRAYTRPDYLLLPYHFIWE